LQHETGITFIFVTHDQEEALTMSDRIAVMSNGRILQVGSPRDIYDRPAERFVANFIGDTNFLERDVKSLNTDKVRVVAGGEVDAGISEGLKPHGRVTVVVRPEQALLQTRPGEDALKGSLDNIVYFGTDTHFHVKLAAGSQVIIRQQNRRGVTDDLTIGMPVGVEIGEKAAQVLKD
jgi:spermidine/putrescine transport system ATP-binding protein